MDSFKEKNEILLRLSTEEAVVLINWLFRFNSNDNNHFEDQAEERILWDLESALEKVTTEVIDEKFEEILLLAKEKVRDVI
ncbi:MAG: hypothetical protein SFU25_07440 [Candidatus Caenarcaniphilales bacterium]|nr:hypothetical protein [Candidatus Caenarcaniphilales bacterium]